MEPTDRGRCPTHDLALGPAGDCVLCRRTLAPAPPPPRGRVALQIVAAFAAVFGVAFGVRSLVSSLGSSPPPPPVLAVSEPPVARTAPPSAEPRTRTERPSRPRARWGTAPTHERPPPEPRALAAPPEAPSGPDPDELQSARRHVSITMYSASWCPSCRHAEAYMREHRIRFTKRDVDEGERNDERLRELNPAGTIPTFEIDERVIVGFGPASLESALDQAALARLARH